VSDQRLAELRRRWQESGTLEDEAAWLRAALRQGQLSEHVLGARAWLEDPAALQALEQTPTEFSGIDPWVRGMAAFDVGPRLEGPQVPNQGWGHPLLVRASLVALELAAGVLDESLHTEQELRVLSDSRHIVASWLIGGHSPEPSLLTDARYRFEAVPSGAPQEALWVCAGLTLAQAMRVDPVTHTARLLATWLDVNLSSAQRMVYTPGHVAAVAVCAAERVVGEGSLRAAIASNLLAWLGNLPTAS
jgi:hypothetical protein